MLKKLTVLLFTLFTVSVTTAQVFCEPLLLEKLQANCAEAGANTVCDAEGTISELGTDVDARNAFGAAQTNFTGLTEEITLTAYLFGKASLLNIGESDASVQVSIGNSRGIDVNLRTGPSTAYRIAGTFEANATGIAVGRNPIGDWLQIITEEGTVWISRGLTDFSGDILSLPVVEDVASSISVLSFNLETSSCEDGMSGVLLRTPAETTAQVQINGINMSLSNADVLIQSSESGGLDVAVLRGEVSANGLAGSTGQWISIPATAADTIISPAAEVQDAYPFMLAAQLPESIFANAPLACIAGVLPDSDTVSALAEPNTDSATAFALDATTHYPVQSQIVGDDEITYWQIADGWLPQASTQTFGACEAVGDFVVATPQPQSQTDSADSAPDTSGGGDAAPAPTQAVSSNNPGASSTMAPEIVIINYLQARADGNAGFMQTLSCSSWDGTAAIQANSFASMNASLQGVSCSTISQAGSTATVACSGAIVTEYNGETRQWPVGTYSLVIEGGEWRMCGEG